MLSRCLAAGPSRTLLLRRLASGAAAAELPSSTPAPSPTTPVSTSPLTSRKGLHNLEVLVGKAKKRATPSMRKSLWEMYRGLSPMQRSSLSADHLRTLLRTLVPRHDEAWVAVQAASPRGRKRMNEQQAESWGKKLRAVLSELVDRGIDERRDWHFILQCLLKVGAVSAVEAVWKSLPEKLQGDREFAELRLGAIIRYAKNARLAAVNPDKEELDLAYGAFWDAFQTLQNPNIKTVRMTNRLLVIASSELAGLMARVENDEAFQSFHQILRFVLDKGYGLDIDNIPLSIERRAQERASSPEAEDKYRSLSPAVLNAVLDHLAQSNTSPYQLFAVFDVLTSEATAPSASMRAFEEEEDEEYVPTLSNMTAAEEQSGERRNWLGRRINRASYFEPSTPEATDASAQASALAEAPASEAPKPVSSSADRLHRSVHDYLPQPVWPREVVANSALPLPKRQPYDLYTVLILLQSAGREGEWGLMQRILEVAVADSLARDAVWLSAYLACPAEQRLSLVRPTRISPEWFACVLGEYTSFYDRYAARTVHVLRRVMDWTQQKIEVVAAAESARSDAQVVDGRVVLPPPDIEPKKLRFLRNDNIFLPADELRRLYRDQDEFATHLARATELATRRAGRYAAATARQKERQRRAAEGLQEEGEGERSSEERVDDFFVGQQRFSPA